MDRADIIIITLIAVLIAMVMVLLVLASFNLDKKTTGAPAEKSGKKGHQRENVVRRAEREALRQRAEHANFMNYDGTAQPPIDVEAIMADRGIRR